MTRIPYSDVFYEQALGLIGKLGKKLMDRSLMFGVAESCTGGLLAALCTEVPGSSAWFAGAVVSYANSVKESVLGVDAAMLRKHGAVSGRVAEAMVLGALRALGVDAAIAITGVAGPGGGTADKPVGLVWIGLALEPRNGRETVRLTQKLFFPGSRQEVRSAAALAALNMLDQALDVV